MRPPASALSRRQCLLATAAVWAGQAAHAQTADGAPLPPELAQALPEARLRGRGTLRFLGMAIYEARLWSPRPLAADPLEQALALELIYARALDGSRIAERSLQEMRGIGSVSPAQAERWLPSLRQLLPDVQAGDRITGQQLPGQATRIFANGAPRGELVDAEFTRLFFGIWLSPRSSQPALRQQLLKG